MDNYGVAREGISAYGDSTALAELGCDHLSGLPNGVRLSCGAERE